MLEKAETLHPTEEVALYLEDSQVAIDSEAKKRLVRTLDLHIIPIATLLYLLGFLDRVNIGNARLYDLEEDLGSVGNQLQILVSILFVTHFTLELPSNWVIKKIRPSRWIAFTTTSWGIIATPSGITRNFGGMLACRPLLGAFEGGLFLGLATHLTFFYTKRDMALHIAYGKRSVTIAMQAMIGNSAGITASFLYPSAEGPCYVKGHIIATSMAAFGVLPFDFMWLFYEWSNKRRTGEKEDGKIQDTSDSKVKKLGSKSPRSVYVT
ncbi:major facilitator superfamily domain-containing protein [Durotheca rogersii]|uniref:major facilitator superfamily domain-containing protein n=1 Tax=Durotheca rogersii TaxID=419775 RepID=UPI00222024C6|nr:major facilitator superfamily domain-containing protein [Durotheca rogersii]KAI5861940.1 major facilitator superfamily domain-containing protein [Durotheca rogersii]